METSKTHIENEIRSIEAFLQHARLADNFFTTSATYQAARRRLAILKNPKDNYHAARTSAVNTYINARQWRARPTPSYMSWARQFGLWSLSEVKNEFSGLIGGA